MYIISGTVYGAGYDCRDGTVSDGSSKYGTDGLYLPDGVWNNVKNHLEWINDLVEKNLTEEVRKDFEFTKHKCEGGSVGKADLLYDQCKKLELNPGSWGQWGPWAQCSRTCGDQGTRERNRRCLKGGRAASANQCSGNNAKEDKSCILPQCPGDQLTFSQSHKLINNIFIYLQVY